MWLEHGSLSCLNILIGKEGDIKIGELVSRLKYVLTRPSAGHESCREMARPNRGNARDMEALMRITMKLMQKNAKENGASGADDMERWPVDCKAVDFLATI
jgi:hypothetical protein